ncbi:MAG: arginyltransferase [Gammaproteobacteria bacterium]|nr:arginyltransferase [Gammaproteobacteria bacterium]
MLVGAEHACGYLPGRRACSAFLDPAFRLDRHLYGELLARGFRRSGSLAYRPACTACAACLSVRIPAARFRPDRAQKRCLRRNAGLALRSTATPSAEQYALYRDYLHWRHPDGGMDPEDRLAFCDFLTAPWGGAEFWEWRTDGRLLVCAVVDRLPRALSAVYTFYAPEAAGRGLGTYAILQLIDHARRRDIAHVYLGYWVSGSPKMDYKRRFRPLEVLGTQGWVQME